MEGKSLRICILLGAIIFIEYKWYLSDTSFEESSYAFKIAAIEYRPNHRAAPHIKIESGWYLLSINEMKIATFIQVGDSIVKKEVRKRLLYLGSIETRLLFLRSLINGVTR